MTHVRMDRHGNVVKVSTQRSGRKARSRWLDREVDRHRAGLLSDEGLAEALLSELGWNIPEGNMEIQETQPVEDESDKQFPAPTPTGHALAPLREQPEITPEQVAEALRDWDAKAPRGWQGLLETEKAE